MKVYQQVSGGYERTITNFNITIDNTYSGFVLAGGTGDIVTGAGGHSGLLNSGFVFSGYEGYIFDESGRFVGGYAKDIPIRLAVHMKTDNTYSYFIGGDLIANNMAGTTGIDCIEFEKGSSSILEIEHIHD